MSRQPAQRTLTLTEELERLEQQITLTLQEIDSNFSKAHRIVTTSILPVVESYAQQSNQVWESSKYWKQFFEAAANVSLSGYEEATVQEDTVTQSEDTTADVTTPEQRQATQQHQQRQEDLEDDFTIDSPTQISGSHSTPRIAGSGKRSTAGSAASPSRRSPSPRKYVGNHPLGQTDDPSTPRTHNSSGLFSSPFRQESTFKPTDQSRREEDNNTVLHRNVLDKNYRVLPTPFKQKTNGQKQDKTTTAATATTSTPAVTQRAPWDDSPDSSPEVSAPQLRSEFFSPPKQSAARPGPRTPGVSVQKPFKSHAGVPTTSTGRKLFGADDKAMHTDAQVPYFKSQHWAADEDEDDEDDGTYIMSPPKTLQFHVPQSRLMQTPAREASKKIVEDLLTTAGLGGDTTSELEAFEEEGSPSVVRGHFDSDATF